MRLILPHPSFAHSVAALDTPTLKLQRGECLRLLCVLGAPNLEYSRRVASNPLVEQWIGFYPAAAAFFTFVLWELEARGIPLTYVPPFNRERERSPGWPGELPERMADVVLPPFIGNDIYHSKVRAHLLRNSKDWTPSEEPVIKFKPDLTPHNSKPKQLEMF